MADTTFTFRLDDDLKSAFAELATSQDRTAAQLLRVLMRAAVQDWRDAQEHDDWLRSEIGRAVLEADDADVERLPHSQVHTSWREQRAELQRRAAGRTA